MDDEPQYHVRHPFVAYLTADVTLTLARADAQYLAQDYLTPTK